MKKKPVQALIVYCSPGGSTRRAASVIETTLDDLGVSYVTADIGSGSGRKIAAEAVKELRDSTVLFVGSPVYVNHPVPPVTTFIADLPEGIGAAAVPFVTWGGASSGVALHDMGQGLANKGLRLMGAAKVFGLHSMMWRSQDPLGEGRPNDEDDRKVRRLIETVIRRLGGTEPGGAISPDDLDYQPAAIREELQASSLKKAVGHLPRREVQEDRCTQCGVCADACPVEAIEMEPFPVFTDACIYCFKCVRECPEDAIAADLSASEANIRARAERFDERPRTRIFV